MKNILGSDFVLGVQRKRYIVDSILIILAIFSAALGLKSFLVPNGLIDGGVTGISLIFSHITKLPLALFILLINIPFIFLGYKNVSKTFAKKALLAILGLSLVIFFIDFPIVTDDRFLVSIFGGLFLGAGIGLAVRGGAVIDGTEVLAVYINKKTNLTIGDIILMFNVIIFSFATTVFPFESVLYSIIIYLVAGKTIDFIIQGIEEYTGVTIISSKNEEIRRTIIEKLNRGVTIYRGKGGFYKDDRIDSEIIYTVVTRLEINRLKSEIEKIDPNAFITFNSLIDAKGGIIKKRPHHKL